MDLGSQKPSLSFPLELETETELCGWKLPSSLSLMAVELEPWPVGLTSFPVPLPKPQTPLRAQLPSCGRDVHQQADPAKGTLHVLCVRTWLFRGVCRADPQLQTHRGEGEAEPPCLPTAWRPRASVHWCSGCECISLNTAAPSWSGLQASMKRLSGEVVELKQHLEHYDKIQELTQMLQESHRCLPRSPGGS